MNQKIMVFIPMYNCERQIPRVLAQFTNEIQKYFVEIVVIDNCSTDKSLIQATEALKNIRFVPTTLIQNEKNIGLGGSHKVAFRYCIDNGFDYCIVLHGDNQGSIEDIIEIIENKEYKMYDSLLGARFAKDSRLIEYSSFRRIGNKFFNYLISALIGENIYDLGSGLNIYSFNFLKDNTYLDFDNDLTFNVFLLLYSIESNKRIKFFPLTWKEEDQISNSKVIRQGFKTLILILKYYTYGINALINRNSNTRSFSYSYKLIYSSLSKSNKI